ncbi:hypothetical protein COLO4_09992 [Corchorus olitorius]|uniref:Uncharacterized protein n=1 Tax=Corchorus olitorius TaxID=93759 RepID=A0A1R3KAC7_9ROSI|nr:hypothetical protein COLO4_09992 [Corchorus olitorius]
MTTLTAGRAHREKASRKVVKKRGKKKRRLNSKAERKNKTD